MISIHYSLGWGNTLRGLVLPNSMVKKPPEWQLFRAFIARHYTSRFHKMSANQTFRIMRKLGYDWASKNTLLRKCRARRLWFRWFWTLQNCCFLCPTSSAPIWTLILLKKHYGTRTCALKVTICAHAHHPPLFLLAYSAQMWRFSQSACAFMTCA